ncbi:MAG: hypothetical protein RAP03_03550, partial [Candidatus Electryonea clarkiae]|nr:hypothetical protein [Candidatus Electryonea clarkiae]
MHKKHRKSLKSVIPNDPTITATGFLKSWIFSVNLNSSYKIAGAKEAGLPLLLSAVQSENITTNNIPYWMNSETILVKEHRTELNCVYAHMSGESEFRGPVQGEEMDRNVLYKFLIKNKWILFSYLIHELAPINQP